MKASSPYRRRLLIFLKEPRAGRVKTRLARGIGIVRAAWWQRRQAARLIRRLSDDPRWETWLAVAPDREGLASRVWPAHLPRWPQGPGDLGARMGGAFRAFPPGPVVIVGADIPELDASHVSAAFRALGDHDAVFCPTFDGGYCLIGLRRSPRRAPSDLFADVRWSSEHALADTMSGLGGARVALLEPLRDVDEAADL